MEHVLADKKVASPGLDCVAEPKGTGKMDLNSLNVLALPVVIQKLGIEGEQDRLRESYPGLVEVYLELLRQKYVLMALQCVLVESSLGLMF